MGLSVGDQMLNIGGPIGFPAFSRPTTQICMLNRPAPGEHLGNQATFQNILVPHGLVFQHNTPHG